jgi:hypothetical protein
MRIAAFARVAAAVATVLSIAPAAAPLLLAPAFAYAPPGLAPEEADPAAPAAETLMRPTTGRKGGLPEHLAPDDDAGEPALEGYPGLEEEGVPASEVGAVEFDGRAHLADIRSGEDGLPAPVAERRRRLIAAAKTGDIEALRPVFADQPLPPVVAALEPPEDPIDFLRRQSGDPEGREILAIMIELLEAGYVAVGEGDELTYVWPYFAEVPLTELTPQHYVELYRVLTAVDVEDLMREGHYAFFRIGISPDGRLRYFTAGEVE